MSIAPVWYVPGRVSSILMGVPYRAALDAWTKSGRVLLPTALQRERSLSLRQSIGKMGLFAMYCKPAALCEAMRVHPCTGGGCGVGLGLGWGVGLGLGAHYLKVEPHFKSKKPNLLQLLSQQLSRILGQKKEVAETHS